MNIINNDFSEFSNSLEFYKDQKIRLIPSIQNNIVNKLRLFKRGGPIKIKEKNKGSFTRYCGGNVTSECIRKGKNSPNPKIRKQAIFAQNARRWKHQNGGVLIQYNIDILNNLLNDLKK